MVLQIFSSFILPFLFQIKRFSLFICVIDKHFWTQGFQMNESKNAVPLFLDNLAEDIFSCGKAINLMKLVNIKVGDCLTNLEKILMWLV